MADFACVDKVRLIENSSAYLDLSKQLDELQASHKKDLEVVGMALQKRNKELMENQDKMTSEVFEGKMEQYKKDVADFQERISHLRDYSDNFKESGLKQIRKKAQMLAEGLILKKKYTGIFDKTSFYLTGDVVDVTDQLLELLNKELPRVLLEKCVFTQGVCDA
jgi:Skp family chaperone for outer membrane proteins